MGVVVNNIARYITRWLLLVLLLGVHVTVIAAPGESMTAEELEEWFNSDEEVVDPLKLINEGELAFLKQEPQRKPHEAQHVITLLPGSQDDGWVRLEQCHDNLDVMPAAQVVFINKRVRKLKVISSNNIEKSWVENDTVQMKKIGRGARLCLSLETRALWKNKDGSYSLRTGPYQRKFLDGYFPMRLVLDIHYAEANMSYRSIVPEVQPGLSIVVKGSSMNIKALFEGMLYLNVRFTEK